MNKRIVCSIGAFLAVCALSALLAWLSGYNFDYRSVGVALYAYITLVFACGAGSAVLRGR